MSFWTKFWTIVAGIVGFLGFCLGAYVFYVDQWVRPKGLAAGLVSISTLLNDKVRTDGKALRVSFGDEPVQNFAIARIQVSNTGGTEIRTGDFEGQPLVFSFNNVRKIYFADPKRHNRGVDVTVKFDATSIQVTPLLINQGDTFSIEAGIDVGSVIQLPTMTTIARIAGISQVSNIALSDISENKKQYIPKWLIALILGIITPTLAILIVTLSSVFRRKWFGDDYRDQYEDIYKRKRMFERENRELRDRNLKLKQQLIRSMHKPKPTET